MKHKIEIAPNLAIFIDGERVIGSKPQGLFLTTEMIVSDEDLKRLADRCLKVISDRKTEQTETQIKTQIETQNSNLPFEKCEYCEYRYARYVGVCDMCELIGGEPQIDCPWK